MTDRCAFERRGFAPGQHGQRRSKLSEFGAQLREKQKVKRVYGMLEKQFRLTFKRSAAERGVTADIFFRNLETRLDNVVYRMGFAASRNEARQVVRHNHILVNGKRCNIPSATMAVGDEIAIEPKSQKAATSNWQPTRSPSARRCHGSPSITQKFSGKITAAPKREDIHMPVKERLIVELYSK